jgi:hypothetical protein
LHGIATLLKPEGVALLFVPCRNAVYARINLEAKIFLGDLRIMIEEKGPLARLSEYIAI